MKLTTAFNYRLKTQLKSTGMFLGTFIAVTLLFPIISILAGSSSDMFVTDFIFPTFFFWFGTNLFTVKTDFKFFIQNGVSRQNIFISYLLSLISISSIMSAFFIFLQVLITNVLPQQIKIRLIITDLYTPDNKLMAFFLLLIVLILAGAIGLIIGTFYNRFNSMIRLVAIILVIASPSIIGMSLYYGGAGFRQAVLSFFLSILGVGDNSFNPFILMGTLLCISLIVTSLSFLMNRKSEI